MIQIIPYQKSLEQKHIDFASNYWTKSRRKIPEYIYWKFRGNQNEELRSFILAIEDDKVIGQLGLIPVKIKVSTIEYNAQWACDLMVANEYRGRGVAKLLYDFAHNLKPITIGSDPSPSALKSMTKNGYNLTESSWKFIFPKNLYEVFKLKKINAQFLKFIPNPFILLLKFMGMIYGNSYHKIKDEDVKEYFFQQDADKFNSVVRDDSFINWRFKPFKKYYKGINVYIDKKGNMYSGYYNNDTFYLTDYKIKKCTEFLILINSIMNQFKTSGIKSIRFFSNENYFSDYLSFLGFIKFRTRNRVIFYTNDEKLKFEMKSKNFYYTYADSDDNI